MHTIGDLGARKEVLPNDLFLTALLEHTLLHITHLGFLTPLELESSDQPYPG